jgi:serine/threonine-protein kinase
MDPSPVRRLISSGSVQVGGFAPGQVVASRYRIIGLLGRGGMGEVYRADDLTLGQPVALKFLPKALADDPVRRERLLAEVRIARQLSHPNLCRVYDVGELDGRCFLTMEFIDGEDLASLLTRIGSVHGAKALDLARQLCAGLAAAHDRGVLHRDLKPANVMIDGRGRVRITDFGVAVAASDEAAAEPSGTPAYMAPEQFAGLGASVRSDVYALGLVLYELYTGRQVFTAATLPELRGQKGTLVPPAPSEISRDIDPAVERVIMRCIDRDPQQRPPSARQVAAALPGGDELAAALAAGETPSPEMVAAAGPTEGLRPWAAWVCILTVVAAIGATMWLGPKTRLSMRIPLEKPPEVLAERARTILAAAGHAIEPAFTAYGFVVDTSYYRYVQASDQSPSRFHRLPDGLVAFWYRRSPSPIDAKPEFGSFSIQPGNPPLTTRGEALVYLDGVGRLIYLEAVPERRADPTDPPPGPEWSRLFSDAGLDINDWLPARPLWAPKQYADSRASWTPSVPDAHGAPIRIEAAAHHGRAVEWWRVDPWDDPAGSRNRPAGQTSRMLILTAVVLTLLVGALWLGRRNLRMGRGDRRGAERLASAVFGAVMLLWALGTAHAPTAGELLRLLAALAAASFTSAMVWLAYVAIEPFARRRWPHALISWNRVLAGRLRDPVVGRDVLIGWTFGLAVGALQLAVPLLQEWIGGPGLEPDYQDLTALLGGRGVAASMTWLALDSLSSGFGLFLLFLLVRLAVRRDWAAGLVLTCVTVVVSLPEGPLVAALSGVFTVAFVLLLLRLGLVSALASLIASALVAALPVTPNLSAWYAGAGLTGIGLALAVAALAFHTSLGGRPIFGRALLDD